MHTWAWALRTWSSWVGWASTVMHTFICTTCHLLILALCGLCIYGCLHCTLGAHAGDWGVGPSVMHIVIYTTCDLLVLGAPMVMYFPACLIVIPSHILSSFCWLCTHILSLCYSQLALVTYIPMHILYTTMFNFGCHNGRTFLLLHCPPLH